MCLPKALRLAESVKQAVRTVYKFNGEGVPEITSSGSASTRTYTLTIDWWRGWKAGYRFEGGERGGGGGCSVIACIFRPCEEAVWCRYEKPFHDTINSSCCHGYRSNMNIIYPAFLSSCFHRGRRKPRRQRTTHPVKGQPRARPSAPSSPPQPCRSCY